MRKLLLLATILVFGACGSSPESQDEIKDQIAKYKKEVIDLNAKIAGLEEKLAVDSAGAGFAVPVYVAALELREFNHYIEANGSVEAVNMAFISPETGGQIDRIYVTEGQMVNQGDQLIKLNAAIVESSIEEVKTSLVLAKTVYERQKYLWDKKIGSEIEYLTAKNNMEALESRLNTLYAQSDMAAIKSPIDGIVDEIFMKEGELALPGMQVMQIVSLTDLYVNADVSEAYLANVSKGDAVLLEFPSLPGFSMEVPVFRVGNVIKEANRTFTLQLKIRNQNGMIKPNSLSVVKINDFSSDSALVVPSLVIKQDLKGSYVYVAARQSDNFRAQKKYIRTGKSYGEETMVVEGLDSGDQVIVSGYNQVSDGAPVAIKNQ
ncbi:MAG: efflux RND transporter periplasmic adaptor subunit [Bacteroidales bacterium]|nr:efflux RND transporter periplasmic adaptor subunit [Bacteroidales bacterium]